MLRAYFRQLRRPSALNSSCKYVSMTWEPVFARKWLSSADRISTIRNLATQTTSDEENSEYNRTSLDRLLRFKPLKEDQIRKDTYDAIDTEGLPDRYLSKDDDEFHRYGDDDVARELDGEPDPRYRLGKLLLALGKIHYRHAEPLPKWFLDRQDEICSYRTNAQIRRCLKDWMVKYDRQEVAKYRFKSLQWGHTLPLTHSNTVQSQPQQQSRNRPAQQHYQYGPEETVAYSFYFMPSRFSLCRRVFGELAQLAGPSFSPQRVLDFGCGPASAAAAVYDVWGHDSQDTTGTGRRSTRIKYTGIDISQAMVDAAKIMTRGLYQDATFYSTSAAIIKRAEQTGERYDLIVASFTLGELPNDPARRVATQMLSELLSVGGYLVLLEPGNPRGSHTIRTARQFLLDTFNHLDAQGRLEEQGPRSTYYGSSSAAGAAGAGGRRHSRSSSSSRKDHHHHRSQSHNSSEWGAGSNEDNLEGESGGGAFYKYDDDDAPAVEMMLPPPTRSILTNTNSHSSTSRKYGYEELGMYTIAPCSHDRACPMGSAGSWCSFSQKVYSGIIRKASEEKFSYVILQKRPKVVTQQQLINNRRRQQQSRVEKEEEDGGALQLVGDLLEGAPLSKSAPRTSSTASSSSSSSSSMTPTSTSASFELEKDRSYQWGRWVEEIDDDDIVPAAAGSSITTGSNSSRYPEELPPQPTPLSILERFVDAGPRDIPRIMDNLLDEIDWEDYRPPLHREEWGRIVRSPIKNKGHITMDVCTPQGQLLRSTLSRANLRHIPALYSSLRKTTWGGLFPVLADDGSSVPSFMAAQQQQSPQQQQEPHDGSSRDRGGGYIASRQLTAAAAAKAESPSSWRDFPAAPLDKKFRDAQWNMLRPTPASPPPPPSSSSSSSSSSSLPSKQKKKMAAMMKSAQEHASTGANAGTAANAGAGLVEPTVERVARAGRGGRGRGRQGGGGGGNSALSAKLARMKELRAAQRRRSNSADDNPLSNHSN